MAQTKIQLNAIEDVKELVNAAEKCDFDIDLSYGRIIVDAKSLLGVPLCSFIKCVCERKPRGEENAVQMGILRMHSIFCYYITLF